MSLLKMSLSGAVLILVIAIIRGLLLHKLPKRTFLILWGVVLCRLLLPFSIPSQFSIYGAADIIKSRAYDTNLPLNGTPVTYSGTAAVNTVSALSEKGEIRIPYFLILWLAGLLACALFFLITHLRCRREYKTALPVDIEFVKHWQLEHHIRRSVQIRQSDKIAAPLTYGIFRPIVLLPKKTDWADETQLRYILIHEVTHIRYFDTLLKLLMAAALCLHWFNPLVWLMYVTANRDIELSCDETVVKTVGEAMKSAYALILIGLEEKKSCHTPFVNNFSKNAMEERITSIMKMKKTSLGGILLACGLVLGITVVFTTGSLAKNADTTKNSVFMAGTLDGKNYTYSDNGGDSWMTEAEYKEKNPDVAEKLEFWKIDEFEKWMEQEKEVYQKLVNDGRQKFYDSESNQWRSWTQQDIDDLYAIWQKQLERMKQGYQYTKEIELPNGTVMTGSFEPETGTAVSSSSSDSLSNQTDQELLTQYRSYGISFDKKGKMYYKKELVRYFWDGIDLGNSTAAVRYEYLNKEGTVDVHTTRMSTDNGDGSIDPFGKLTGIEKYSQDEFNKRNLADLESTSEAVTTTSGNSSGGETFAQKFARYKEYGIEYRELDGSSSGNVYYKGRLIKTFVDKEQDGGVFTFQSAGGGEMVVHTVYDKNGKLIGVEKQ